MTIDNLFEQVRLEDANYADKPDEYIADDLYKQIGEPAGASRDVFYKDVLGIDAPSFTGEFGKAFKRSFAELGVLAKDAAPAAIYSGLDKALEKGLGIETDLDQKAVDKAVDAQVAMAAIEEEFPRFVKTRHDVNNVKTAMQYGGALMGQGLGSTLEVLIPGILTGGASFAAQGAGKLAIKSSLKAAAKKAGKTLTEEQLEKQMSKGIGGRILNAPAFKRGTQVGTALESIKAETGSTYMDLLAQGKDAPGTAIIAGLLKGSLEVLPEFAAASRLFKAADAKDALVDATAKQILKRYGVNASKEILKTGTGEALTEATQQMVDVAANEFVMKNDQMFTPGTLDSLIEAGIAGFVGAGPIGAISGAAQTAKDIAQPAVEGQAKVFEHDTLVEEIDDTQFREFGGSTTEDIVRTLEGATDVVFPDDTVNLVEGHNAQLRMSQRHNDFLKGTFNPLVEQVRQEEKNTDTPTFSRKDDFELSAKGEPMGGIPLEDTRELAKAGKTKAKPAGKPIKATIADVKKAALPTELAGAKPKYNFGDRAIELNYDSDVAKALHIIGKRDKVSKADAKYVNWLKDQGIVNPVLEGRKMMRAVKEAARTQDKVDVKVPADVKLTAPLAVKTQEMIDMPAEALEPIVQTQNPELYDVSTENLRGTKLSTKVSPEAVKRIENAVRNVAGKAVSLTLAEDLRLFQDENVASAPLRGAQLLNNIYVALGFNTRMGYSSMETAMHESFHAIYQSTLTAADKLMLENERSRLVDYVASKVDGLKVDLDAFDTEELAATAFGLWSEEYLAKKNVHKLGPIQRVFKKIANILRSLRDGLRKEGVSKFEDLFEDAANGNKALKSAASLLNQDRIVRLQNVIANAHQRSTEQNIDTPQNRFIKADELKKELGIKMELGLSNWEGMQSWIINALNTSPGVAAKDPVYGYMAEFLRAQDENVNVLDRALYESMKEVRSDPARMTNAGGVLDYLNSTEQKLVENSFGQLIYEKDGKYVRLDQKTSEDVKSLAEGFNTILKLWRDTTREKLREIDGFNSIEEAIKAQEEIISRQKKNPAAHEKAAQDKAKRRLNELRDTQDMLGSIKRKIESKVPYFPRMATGQYGVKITKVGAPNDPLPQGFAMIGSNAVKPGHNEKELAEVKDRWAKELGYSGSEYKITPVFKLTRNSIKRELRGSEGNLELLASILSSADPKLAGELQDAVEHLGGDLSKLKISKHFLERNDLLLYSRNANAVIPTYFSTSTRAINRYRYAETNAALKEMVDTGIIETPHGQKVLSSEAQKYYKDQFDYFTSPAADMAKIRAFNFFWAMGGNVSSALLQLVTLPTQIVGVMNTYGGNPISNNAVVARNFATVSKMMADAKFDIEKFSDPDFLRKHLKDDKLVRAVKSAHDRGAFRPSRAEDMLGSDSFSSGEVGGGYLQTIRDKGQKWLAAPVQAAEETSRVSAFLSLYETLREDTNPTAMHNFETEYAHGNHRYNAFKSLNSNIDPAVIATLFAIDDTHGIFGKHGRGKNQQGAFGSLIFPFMQHPMMMMGLFVRMANGGAMSKASAVYAILATSALAGLYGVPGWELWKTTMEFLFKHLKGREIDIHHEIKKAMVQAGIAPKWAEASTDGMVKPFLGADIGRRIGVPIFFQDALIAMMKGRDSIDQFMGVAGSQVKAVGNTFTRGMAGELGPMDAVMETMSPIAFRNMYKAVAMYPQKGIRTGKGTQISAAGSLSPMELFYKAFGIQPSQITREYEKRNAERLGTVGWRLGYDRHVNRIATKTHELMLAREAGDTAEIRKLKENIDKEYEKLYAFAKSVGKNTDKAFQTGINRSVDNKIMNRRFPDIPKKQSELVDQELLNLIYEKE
jgi:hypothetical protein